MVLLDLRCAFKVSYGAGHLEDTAVGAGREVQSLHGRIEEAGGGGIQGAVFLHHAGGHLCVAVDATDTAAGDGRGILEALALDGAGGGHALADDAAWFAALQVTQLGDGHGGHLHLYVDAVEQGAADFVHVALYLAWATGAGVCGMVVVAAGAGIHRGYQHEGGG